MRQDKDRSGKWLLAHHGDAVLRLGGITGFTSWRAVQPETVAPRRLPDGLLEVRFPGESDPTLVLVEIETYPDADADRQVFDDLMLIAVDRKVVPEVVALVLRPKGNLKVVGSSERSGSRGRTRLSGSWPVVRLWEQDAEALLAAGDPGLIPWVPLARTAQTPDEVMTRCRDRLASVPDPSDREGLTVVTQILAGLAFPGRQFLNLFGGKDVVIDSPFMDHIKELITEKLRPVVKEAVKAEARAEVKEEVKAEARAEVKEEVKAEVKADSLRRAIVTTLEARFGAVPPERLAALAAVTGDARFQELLRLAATCPDVEAFVAGLAPRG